jgi:hypothetical protein
MYKKIGEITQGTTSLALDESVPPGFPIDVLALTGLETPERDNERLYDPSPRSFQVSGLLSKFPRSTDNHNYTKNVENGSSYTRISENQQIETPNGVVKMIPNSRGELALLVFECTETSFAKARRRFMRAASPMLDNWSYKTNTPVYIDAIGS